MTKKQRFEFILKYFSDHRADVDTELQYKTPYELIVAVILSAQCTDKRVNIITPAFFKKYPDFKVLSEANIESVFNLIRSCSYPNNKAKHLIGMAKTVFEKFKNILPQDIEQLEEIPGVGRKTANVLASVLFNKPVIAVDTHVFRVSARIGLATKSKTPLDTEKQLEKYIPENLRPIAHHWLLLHGRYICMARNPQCDKCPISEACRFYEKKISDKVKNNQENKK